MNTPSTALVNGNWGFGQVACTKAMELAIDKARKTGVGAVGIFNCNHIGRLADYVQMAVENDMIGLVTANTDPCVAAYGGRARVLGTNPLSCGIPAGHEKPIVVDYATSVVAEGKVRAALYKGQQLPPGWIVDPQGHPSTNPADLYEPPLPPERIKLAGALLPAGGHKGYGLSLMIEILAGALTGTGCGREVTSGCYGGGVFIIVLKVDQFVPLEGFKARVDRLIKTIKNSPKAQGFEEILIPGEPEFKESEKRSKGGIMIAEKAWQPLVEACKQYGLDVENLMRT
jgi:LDH2 family malate/lactate/ureidoglycolate dehydrogenase